MEASRGIQGGGPRSQQPAPSRAAAAAAAACPGAGGPQELPPWRSEPHPPFWPRPHSRHLCRGRRLLLGLDGLEQQARRLKHRCDDLGPCARLVGVRHEQLVQGLPPAEIAEVVIGICEICQIAERVGRDHGAKLEPRPTQVARKHCERRWRRDRGERLQPLHPALARGRRELLQPPQGRRHAGRRRAGRRHVCRWRAIAAAAATATAAASAAAATAVSASAAARPVSVAVASAPPHAGRALVG
eukprot:scaffold63436_cov39-Phaeocystis_antarctica.AAC.1